VTILAIALAFIFGFVSAVLIGIILTRADSLPERPRYSAIGGGSTVYDSSQTFGAVPSDWQPIWNPGPSRC